MSYAVDKLVTVRSMDVVFLLTLALGLSCVVCMIVANMKLEGSFSWVQVGSQEGLLGSPVKGDRHQVLLRK